MLTTTAKHSVAEVSKFVSEIAKQLGCKFIHKGDVDQLFFVLTHSESGASFYLSASQDYRYRGAPLKFYVNAYNTNFPKDCRGVQSTYYDISKFVTEISCSYSRGPKAVANDIEGRFMPGLIELWTLLLKQAETRSASFHRILCAANEIEASLRGFYTVRNHDEGHGWEVICVRTGDHSYRDIAEIRVKDWDEKAHVEIKFDFDYDHESIKLLATALGSIVSKIKKDDN